MLDDHHTDRGNPRQTQALTNLCKYLTGSYTALHSPYYNSRVYLNVHFSAGRVAACAFRAESSESKVLPTCNLGMISKGHLSNGEG